MSNEPEFLQKLDVRDPEFAEQMSMLRSSIRSEGALRPKTKLLLAMALDAGRDHPQGVETLADDARKHGASEDEILEAIEVVAAMCGIQGLVVGMNAFEQ